MHNLPNPLKIYRFQFEIESDITISKLGIPNSNTLGSPSGERKIDRSLVCDYLFFQELSTDTSRIILSSEPKCLHSVSKITAPCLIK